ncbi:hypothetical protein CPLU01_10891 [Colletotrichum plurivorum]|uniref:Uncharacterized protein n=1 Tax=Colletotrichum plurivorum TaxID=2175906 RepID=A0A8H6K501_9PEZI|nr:hypothetical protein CPLU01_10891 [Colletotrichum plurivorum]
MPFPGAAAYLVGQRPNFDRECESRLLSSEPSVANLTPTKQPEAGQDARGTEDLESAKTEQNTEWAGHGGVICLVPDSGILKALYNYKRSL